jgi:hypothetical protein
VLVNVQPNSNCRDIAAPGRARAAGARDSLQRLGRGMPGSGGSRLLWTSGLLKGRPWKSGEDTPAHSGLAHFARRFAQSRHFWWSACAKVARKESCTAQEAIGGAASYVSLLTRLQLNRWVRKPRSSGRAWAPWQDRAALGRDGRSQLRIETLTRCTRESTPRGLGPAIRIRRLGSANDDPLALPLLRPAASRSEPELVTRELRSTS